jgi:DNA polymerase-4
MSDFSDPAEADRGDLADLQTPKLKAMENALDAVRARFGDAAIEKGLSLRDTRRATSRTRSPEADPDA